MSDPKCGAHCGLYGAEGCIDCEMHGLCHMCIEEDWARKFERSNALMELWKSAEEACAPFIHSHTEPDINEMAVVATGKLRTARKFESEAK